MLDSAGLNNDFTCFSITSFSCIIVIVNLKLAITTRLWTFYHVLSILLLSVGLYLGFILVYDSITTNIFYKSVITVLASYYFYLCIFTAASWIFVFDGAWVLLQRVIVPKQADIFMEECVKDEIGEKKALNRTNL